MPSGMILAQEYFLDNCFCMKRAIRHPTNGPRPTHSGQQGKSEPCVVVACLSAAMRFSKSLCPVSLSATRSDSLFLKPKPQHIATSFSHSAREPLECSGYILVDLFHGCATISTNIRSIGVFSQFLNVFGNFFCGVSGGCTFFLWPFSLSVLFHLPCPLLYVAFGSPCRHPWGHHRSLVAYFEILLHRSSHSREVTVAQEFRCRCVLSGSGALATSIALVFFDQQVEFVELCRRVFTRRR